MIDLHCHLLPGIDDGSVSLAMSLEMARIAVGDGISTTACTPHIYPGLFENRAHDIRRRVDLLAAHLKDAGIELQLTYGADIQLVPELIGGLRSGQMPTLHGSRYFLFEPPHHTVPQTFSQAIHDSLAAGYVPVVTHPERLTWLDNEHYPWFVAAVRSGAWMQITAGALVGRFGRRARYWSERFLGDGLTHILATDAHEPLHRPPWLHEGKVAAATLVGAAEAERLVVERPLAILEDREPDRVAPLPGLAVKPADDAGKAPKRPWHRRLLGLKR